MYNSRYHDGVGDESACAIGEACVTQLWMHTMHLMALWLFFIHALSLTHTHVAIIPLIHICPLMCNYTPNLGVCAWWYARDMWESPSHINHPADGRTCIAVRPHYNHQMCSTNGSPPTAHTTGYDNTQVCAPHKELAKTCVDTQLATGDESQHIRVVMCFECAHKRCIICLQIDEHVPTFIQSFGLNVIAIYMFNMIASWRTCANINTIMCLECARKIYAQPACTI